MLKAKTADTAIEQENNFRKLVKLSKNKAEVKKDEKENAAIVSYFVNGSDSKTREIKIHLSLSWLVIENVAEKFLLKAYK